MSGEPLRSASSLFVERWASAERHSVSQGLAVYLLGALCVVLVGALVFVSTRPRPIHYVPAAGGASWPGRVPSTAAVSFASAWLMNWTNYSPGTVDDVYERSLVFMAPALVARIRAGLDEELGKVARDRISSVFTLGREPLALEKNGGFSVVFEGERAVYIGKEEMSREEVRFTLEVRPAYPTEVNPYGLVVMDVTRTKADKNAP